MDSNNEASEKKEQGTPAVGGEEAEPKQGSQEQGAAPAEGVAAQDPRAEAEERVRALEQEKQDLRERMLRIAADFDNYKKRVRKELAEAEAKGRELLLKELFSVIDNLERALSHVQGPDGSPPGMGLVEGVRMVHRQFLSVLEKFGVKQFSALGEAFDPQYHMAVQRVETSEKPAGMVVEEYQKGYRMGEQLLRPAMVAVAAPPQPPKEASAADETAKAPENAETGGTEEGDGKATGASTPQA